MPEPTPSGHQALRRGRYSQPGHAYAVTAVTHGRRPLFADFALGRVVVAEMRALDEAGAARSLAWVVMPDHVHWLFELGAGHALAGVVRTLKARSAHLINRHLAQSGAVWQTAYYDHALRRDEDFRAVARYIVANPLRAGIVRDIGEYPLWDAVWL